MNRHFDESEWIDFARGLLNPAQAAQIEAHLNDACEQCATESFLWRAIVSRSSQESLYEPPSHALRSVKAAYALANLYAPTSWPMRFAQLIADSSLAPAAAGFRSGPPRERQLVYNTGGVSVELSLDSAPASGKLAITGQAVLDQPDGIVDHARVMLVHESEIMQESPVTKYGEFILDGRAGLSYWLVLDLTGESPIALQLP